MAQRKGWERIRGGCAGIWRHSSGWIVRHCGHPTAVWPYYGVSPAGEMLINERNGRAFQRLVEAQAAVEAKIAALPPQE
jgi:hypothetical protein